MIGGILATVLGSFFGSGLVPTITKFGIQFAAPLVFVFLRFLFATLFFFPFFLFSQKRKLNKSDIVRFMILAFFLFANVTLFTIGVKFTTVIMSQLLYLPTPIVVSIFGHFFLQEKLTKQKIIGLTIALFGVLFLLYQSVASQSKVTFGTPFGNFLIIIAMLGYSGWVLYTRLLSKSNKYSPFQLTFFTFFFIMLYLLILLPFQQKIVASAVAFTLPKGVFFAMLLSLVSIVQYFFLQLGIKKTSAFTASLFQYTGPVFAGLVAIPVLGEKISLSFFIGGLIIIAGVFYATTYEYIKRRIK